MWDIRYRPLKFGDVLGQEGAVQVLKARLKAGTALDVSYIFSGGHGQGKTTLARILARALLCQDLQDDGEPCNECGNCQAILSETTAAFSELDAASKGTIDNIRGIVDDLPFVIPGAPIRVYLFDEAHRMSRDAQDVLLKPIEDKKMVGVFCTTEPEKIRGAIKSRCEEYSIRKITREEILKRMKWILNEEGVEHTDDAVLTVIDHSGRHVRDVLNKLEMIAQMGPVTETSVREYLNLSVVSTYFEILLSLGDPAKAVGLVEQACDRVGVANVSGGIAEAAMNAYRLANGMFADFAFVDRDLAKKVYELYGLATLKLAEHFLGRRRPSKVGLICDVLACSKGVPTQRPATQQKPAPVQVVAAPTQPALAPNPRTSVEPSVKETVPTTDKPPESPKAVEVAPSSKNLPNKFANPPLTELDDKVLPRMAPPRGSEREASTKPLFSTVVEEHEPATFIPAARFEREFEIAWNHSRGHRG